MQRHVVKAHQRQVPRSKFDRYMTTHKRTVRVNSYRRGKDKPETKPIVKPAQPKAPVDPIREKTEQHNEMNIMTLSFIIAGLYNLLRRSPN